MSSALKRSLHLAQARKRSGVDSPSNVLGLGSLAIALQAVQPELGTVEVAEEEPPASIGY